jgi:hypothetical protein
VTSKEDIMKITVLGTLFAGLLALNPAHAGSIDLLAIWSSDGVDADAADNGVADTLFCTGTCGGTISAGDISDITFNEFYDSNGKTAQDHPDPDMINILAFEGVVIPNLAGDKTENGLSGKSFNIAIAVFRPPMFMDASEHGSSVPRMVQVSICLDHWYPFKTQTWHLPSPGFFCLSNFFYSIA